MTRSPPISGALALTLLLAPSVASADLEDAVGVGVEAMALGGAVGAVGGGYSATIYNPAALAQVGSEPGPVVQLGISFYLSVPDLWVEGLDGAPAPEVTAAPGNYGVMLGARMDVGRALGIDGLHLGVSIYAPSEGLVVSTIVPDDRVQWMMWTDRLRHVGIFAGLSLRLVEWLSVGVGVRVSFDTGTFISARTIGVVRTDDEVRITARIGVESAIFLRSAPVLGVRVVPVDELRLAFSWRGAITADDWGWTRLQEVPGITDLGFLFRFAHVVRPHALRWAAAFRVIDELEVSADLEWQLWSEGVSGNNAPLPGRFGDTLIIAAGVRVTPTPWLDILGGYRYVPSPFSNFGGPTNLLTASRHVASLGVSVDLDPLIADEVVPLTIRLGGRLGFFESRTEEKDGRRFSRDIQLFGNPGYLGYRYGGLVPSAQLEVETRW